MRVISYLMDEIETLRGRLKTEENISEVKSEMLRERRNEMDELNAKLETPEINRLEEESSMHEEWQSTEIQMLKRKIASQASEIERLQGIPNVMETGGTSTPDRVERVINKQRAKTERPLQELEDIARPSDLCDCESELATKLIRREEVNDIEA